MAPTAETADDYNDYVNRPAGATAPASRFDVARPAPALAPVFSDTIPAPVPAAPALEYQGADDRVSFDDSFAPTESRGADTQPNKPRTFLGIPLTRQDSTDLTPDWARAENPVAAFREAVQDKSQGVRDAIQGVINPASSNPATAATARSSSGPGYGRTNSAWPRPSWPAPRGAPSIPLNSPVSTNPAPNPAADGDPDADMANFLAQQMDGTPPTAPAAQPTAPVTQPTAPVTQPTAPVTQPEVPMYEAGFDDPMTVEGTKLKFKVLRDWGDNIAPDGSGLPSSRAPHTYRPIETVDTQAQLDALKPHTPYVTKHGKFGMTGAAVPKAPNQSALQTEESLDTRYTMEPSLASRPAEMERAPLTGDDYHRTGRRFGEAVGDYGRPMVSVYPQGNANELMNRFNTANTGNASTDPRRVAEMLANNETIRGPSILTFVNDEEDYTKLPPGAVYMSPGGVGKKGTGTGYIDMRGQFQPLRYGAANAGGVIAGESPVDGKAVSPQTLQETRRKVTQGYNVPGQGTGNHGSVQSEQFTVVSTEEARRKLPLGTAYITPDGTMAIRGTGQVTLDANGYLVVTTRPSENKVSDIL